MSKVVRYPSGRLIKYDDLGVNTRVVCELKYMYIIGKVLNTTPDVTFFENLKHANYSQINPNMFFKAGNVPMLIILIIDNIYLIEFENQNRMMSVLLSKLSAEALRDRLQEKDS